MGMGPTDGNGRTGVGSACCHVLAFTDVLAFMDVLAFADVLACLGYVLVFWDVGRMDRTLTGPRDGTDGVRFVFLHVLAFTDVLAFEDVLAFTDVLAFGGMCLFLKLGTDR